MRDLSFTYRLPLTYVRITGTRTTSRNALTDVSTVECRSAVTTETGADLLTRCPVALSPATLETQHATWNFLADGRITGSETTITAEPLAAWTASLSAGLAVLSAAGPPLIAAGPPGWFALAGLTGAAAVGTGLLGHGVVGVSGDDLLEVIDDQPTPPPELPPLDPVEWDVHPEYVREDEPAAQVLANYRATQAVATRAHAEAVRGALDSTDTGAAYYWERRVKSLERLLASATAGAASAEGAYAVWRATKITTVDENFDQRLRIDVLPDFDQLAEWARQPGIDTSDWRQLARRLGVVVTVDVESTLDDDQRLHHQEFEPLTSDDVVYYRQPRLAVLRTWKLVPEDENDSAYSLERVETQRLLVAYPGNEASLAIRPGDGADSVVAVTFAESGALTKISAERTDPALQRAHAISGLIPALKDAAEAGSSIRAALSPPSLVDRAAEAKAARELGLVPTAADPLQALKDQVAEQELRARLRLSQQLATATSPPVFVTVRER